MPCQFAQAQLSSYTETQFHLQLHAVQGGDVEVEVLGVHSILLILLL